MKHVAALVLLAAAPAAAEVRILVSAGSNIGLADETPLRWADRDAARVAEVMTRLGGVASGDAIVRAGADVAALEQALDHARDLAARHRAEDVVVFFYFSGHGDEGALHLDGARLPLARIDALVEAVPARLRVVVIDACRTAGRDKGLVRGDSFEVDVRRASGPAGTVRVWSSVAGEAAQESDALGGAVFTHYWLSGLAGAADENRDREVTFGEAYDHAATRTLGRSAAAQRPSFETDLRGERSLVVTRLDTARATLRLPEGDGVRYLVYRLPAGTLLVESDGAPRPLAVPPGRLLVQRRAAGRHGAVTVAVAAGEMRAVGADEFEDQTLEELLRKGGAVETDPHRVWAGPALAFGARGEVGPGLAAGWRRHDGALFYGLRLGAASTERTTEDARLEERSLGLGAEAGRLWRTGDWELAAGGGLGARGLEQTRIRDDAERLRAAGFATEETFRALGGGPFAALRADWAPATWARVGVGLVGHALGLREDGALTVRFDGAAEIDFGLAF